MSIALGGCLKAPPIALGLTEDTGGHLTYMWGAASALSRRSDVTHVELVTRLICDAELGDEYSRPCDRIGPGLTITRIKTGNCRYLSKEAAVADRPAFIASLIALLEQRGDLPDVVHAHFADAAEVAIALRHKFGIPYIYTAHSLAIDKKACGLGSAELNRRIDLEDRAIAQADAIIASSRDEAERQLMLYPSARAEKIHRVPPGATMTDQEAPHTGTARNLITPFLTCPDKPMLLAIARPVRKKNLSALVELYAANEELRARANLVIVAGLRDEPQSGEAEQQEVIRGLLDQLDRHDLYGSMALPKRHTQADIPALYALAAETRGVFINPALTEPYGLTLTEAAHYGLPVVATDNGGPPDIIRQLQHGLTADPASPGAFAAAILDLLSDEDRWQQASISGRSNSRQLTWTSYADRFAEIARGLTVAVRDVAATRAEDTLLLSDIDNTLTGCRRGSAELCSYMANNQHLMFGVATGRSLQEAQRILREWNFPMPAVWITSVGSEIYWSEKGGLQSDRDYAAVLESGWDAAAVEGVVATIPGLMLQPQVEQRRFKRSWFGRDIEQASEVSAALDHAGIKAKVIFSHGRFLDVLPEHAGKGAAMRWVAAKAGVPLSSVIVAGDSGNDLDMLSECPNAVLVANHSDELDSLRSRSGVYIARRAHAGGIVDYFTDVRSHRSLECAA